MKHFLFIPCLLVTLLLNNSCRDPYKDISVCAVDEDGRVDCSNRVENGQVLYNLTGLLTKGSYGSAGFQADSMAFQKVILCQVPDDYFLTTTSLRVRVTAKLLEDCPNQILPYATVVTIEKL